MLVDVIEIEQRDEMIEFSIAAQGETVDLQDHHHTCPSVVVLPDHSIHAFQQDIDFARLSAIRDSNGFPQSTEVENGMEKSEKTRVDSHPLLLLCLKTETHDVF